MARLDGMRKLAQDWCPPRLARALRRPTARFEGPFDTWKAAAARAGAGFSAETILQRVQAATLAVRNGDAAYERDGVTFAKEDPVWPLLACLMQAAAVEGGALNVIDFGGSLGSTFTQHRRFLTRLLRVHWSVVEQEAFVRCGRELLEDEYLSFHDSIADCTKAHAHQVALVSSVLQYVENPRQVIHDLHAAGVRQLIIARTAVDRTARSDRYYVQHVDPAIYPAKYPIRIFTDRSLRECCQPFTPVAEVASPVDRQEPFAQVGVLFRL
jgi:putative methyltransferase (TIGR04325 family)